MAADSVGLGAYGMDSHNMQRYVDAQGHVRNEGDVAGRRCRPLPGQLSLDRAQGGRVHEPAGAGLPVGQHIAYGSIRMEPVFMVLGQSAATAAVLAVDDGVDVQQVDYARLRARLLKDKQILAWQAKRK